MDDDYMAPKDQQGGLPSCPAGKIRRVGYTSKRGRKTLRVKSTCIKDVGAKGRWRTVTRSLGIGSLRKGDLKAFGYDPTASSETRHAALKKAIARFGKLSTGRKLNAIATYTKRTVPSRSKTYRRDRNWVNSL